MIINKFYFVKLTSWRACCLRSRTPLHWCGVMAKKKDTCILSEMGREVWPNEGAGFQTAGYFKEAEILLGLP